MVCKFVKIQRTTKFSIWLDIEEPFVDEIFLEDLRSLGGIEVVSTRTLLASLGPTELIIELSTNMGKFCLSKEFEGLTSGICIYSDDQILMERILDSLLHSENFRQSRTQIVKAP